MKRLASILTLWLCFFVASMFFPGSFVFSKDTPKKPGFNVLLISIDTLRPDRLSCYSKEHLQTPHIDKLAQRGILFTRAFAHNPMTLPSHTNILLGTTPPYHGVHDNSSFIVRDEFVTLAEHLKGYGYSTGAFVGAFPMDSRFGLTQGFDVYDDNYGSQTTQEFSYVERKAEEVVAKALDWVQKAKTPWFLWVHCFDPHQRYDPPEPFKTQFKDHPYNGEVAYVDFALGKLFDYLETNRLYDRTSIFFTGDHGESLGEHGETTHGYFAYNGTLWVPLILASPGLGPGKVSQDVCHIDLFPTVCDILGIKKPDFLQGVSLLPTVKGKKLPERMIYFESMYPYYSRGWAPLKGFIEGGIKYIESPIPEFYDLEKDFDEISNLALKVNLKKYSQTFAEYVGKISYADKNPTSRKIDREALEKLKSLGYVSSPQAVKKDNFTRLDDLKVLLPYQNKLQMAMGAYHKGNIDEGIALLKEIIAVRKDFDLAYSYLATLYKEKRQMREAVAVLKEGFENNPSSFKLITSYGIFLVDAEFYDEAIAVLQSGLALIDYDPELWNYLGVAYYRKGDFQNGLNAFEKALALDKNYPIAFNNLGSLYLSLFLKTNRKEDFQNAIQNFEKAVELDPNYASAYNGLGAAYLKIQDLEKAVFYWEKAVAIKPDYGFALYNLGLVYLARGQKDKALDHFKKYKSHYYLLLSPKEQADLDSLIQKCQQVP